MSILFLSPHYDDAVYSCGGSIYELVQRGEDVQILTIMAGIPRLPLPETPILKALRDRWDLGDNEVLARRKEDETAARIVGAKTRYLDIPDCIYRTLEGQALYPSEESLWGEVHPQDPAYTVLANESLEDASLIYAPLGVGRHVDHQLVRSWALKLQAKGHDVRFYQDYPYLRQHEAVDEALSHFGAMQAYPIVLSEAAVQAKIAAMAAYASQISTFWANEVAMNAEVRQTFAYEDSYAELSWGKQT